MTIEGNLAGSCICRTANTVVVGNFILVCLVVCIENDRTCLSEELRVVRSTVAGCAAGYVVPCGECVTCLLCGRKLDRIANSVELISNLVTTESIEDNTMSDNGSGNPIGNGLAVNETNLYYVCAIAVKSYGRGINSTGNLSNLAIVNLNLVVFSADYGSPSKLALSVAYLLIHLVVTSNNYISCKRGTGAHSANCYGVIKSFNEVDNAYKIEGGFSSIISLAVNGYFVLLCTGNYVPRKNATVKKKVFGCFESSLVVYVFGCFGRNIAICLGIYLNYDTTFNRRALLKAHKCLSTKVNEFVIVGCVSALNGNHVAFCGSNLVPVKDLSRIIEAEAAYAIKISGVNEYIRGRGCVTVCNCSNGKLDTVIGHSTVSEVVHSGSTVIKISVLVLGVAAHNGNEILLCVVNGTVYKSVSDNVELRYLGQYLVNVGSDSLSIVICAGISKRGNLDLINAGSVRIEGYVNGGRTGGLVDNNVAVRTDYLNVVGSCAFNGIPDNATCKYVNDGSFELAARSILYPKCVESSVCINNHSILILVGEGLAISAEPPATEGVAISVKRRKVKELAAYGSSGLKSCRIIVVSVKLNGKFLTGYSLNTPSCIYGGILGNGSSTESVRSSECCISIPANEHVAFTCGISRLGSGSAVNNGLSCYCATAVYVKGNGVGKLLKETHSHILEGKCYYTILVGCCYVFLALCVKVEHESTVGERVATGVKCLLNIERECVTNIECQCVFVVYIIKVVNSGFRP